MRGSELVHRTDHIPRDYKIKKRAMESDKEIKYDRAIEALRAAEYPMLEG